MSDFKFNCPHCGQSLEAPEDMLGETITCPACTGSIVLP
jgi:DNA-directed RNA polymerase subunit RPC12/RpoP